MTEYITKDAVISLFEKWSDGYAYIEIPVQDAIRQVSAIHPADVRPVPPGGIGEMSDGYHTFNGLYYQRKVLFASLVNAYKENAWKSYRHEDGELCFGGGWFIVGVETPKGNYTYHYENKDFDLFDCKELPVAPHWDWHTEGDVTRLLSLPDVRPVVRGHWEERIVEDRENDPVGLFRRRFYCSVCGEWQTYGMTRYCDCGSYNGGDADG